VIHRGLPAHGLPSSASEFHVPAPTFWSPVSSKSFLGKSSPPLPSIDTASRAPAMSTILFSTLLAPVPWLFRYCKPTPAASNHPSLLLPKDPLQPGPWTIYDLFGIWYGEGSKCLWVMRGTGSIGSPQSLGGPRFQEQCWLMRESCVKLRPSSNIILQPSTIRRPRYFYVKALLQPVKDYEGSRAYYYSDQSAFSASREAQADFKLMSGPSISSHPHFLVRSHSFPLVLLSSLVLLLHARISNIQMTLSYSDHLFETVPTTVSLLTQVPRSRSSSPTPQSLSNNSSHRNNTNTT
jgi:hypothetical protein